MTPSTVHIERFKRDVEGYADMMVRAEFIKGTFYVFACELACLRILAKYHSNPNARIGYSDNRNTWYFSLETNL